MRSEHAHLSIGAKSYKVRHGLLVAAEWLNHEDHADTANFRPVGVEFVTSKLIVTQIRRLPNFVFPN